MFPGYGRFRGTVTEVDGELCVIEYDDGDTETIDMDEVQELVEADKPLSTLKLPFKFILSEGEPTDDDEALARSMEVGFA